MRPAAHGAPMAGRGKRPPAFMGGGLPVVLLQGEKTFCVFVVDFLEDWYWEIE